MAAPALEVEGLSKAFGQEPSRVIAADRVTFQIQQAELFTLLGPSGCGKTTTLRLVAGLEVPDAGRVIFAGIDWTPLPPYRRSIGMVFQSYALFPHMNVSENVAYGLRVRGTTREETVRRVEEAVALVGLAGTQRRRPGQLSGGQQQRVALARALVYHPQLLLLDEPLSNLDAKLRVYMRGEIRRIQRQAEICALYVTHDQEEALSISDRIAVMHAGRVAQVGTPSDIYERPASVFVADFVGKANFLECTVAGREDDHYVLRAPAGETVRARAAAGHPPLAKDAPALLFLRPERVRLKGAAHGDGLRARITEMEYLGSLVRYTLAGAGGWTMLVDAPPVDEVRQGGDPVAVTFSPDHAQVFPRETGPVGSALDSRPT
jgi:ABC-type Fe3+/spermidine/putrescine transport system ATPase subunit